jgi:hypothetical protein
VLRPGKGTWEYPNPHTQHDSQIPKTSPLLSSRQPTRSINTLILTVHNHSFPRIRINSILQAQVRIRLFECHAILLLVFRSIFSSFESLYRILRKSFQLFGRDIVPSFFFVNILGAREALFLHLFSDRFQTLVHRCWRNPSPNSDECRLYLC